ncbi:MAG: folylpolyglutamate synthase/dihydrofolate synthase family protein [Gilvibacter sp.]
MEYQETLDWLFRQLPAYQRVGKAAYKANLDNIEELCLYLESPEKRFKSIHVTGTNGKGSTSHMLASVLQEAGYKVGLYTSPHLKDFRERIKINGTPIAKEEVVTWVAQHRPYFEQHELSFFEMTVGLAFECFANARVDIAIIEVGLGGRLDSTNVIKPELSVITNIGLDHTQFLGTTLEQIAQEKGGIIKEGIPVVIGQMHNQTTPIFLEIAEQKKAPIHFAEAMFFSDYTTDLLGEYQQYNVNTAMAALEILGSIGWNFSLQNIRDGLNKVVKNTGLLGRWQILGESPIIIADTAHNLMGLTSVMNQLNGLSYNTLHIVLGMVNDKDLDAVLTLFPTKAEYYFCSPDIQRGLDAFSLQEKAGGFNLKGAVYPSVFLAFEAAKSTAKPEDVIFVGGSTFVVAEIL